VSRRRKGREVKRMLDGCLKDEAESKGIKAEGLWKAQNREGRGQGRGLKEALEDDEAVGFSRVGRGLGDDEAVGP